METLWYFASGRVRVYFMTKMKICVPTEHVLRWDLYDLTCAMAGTGALRLEIGHNVNDEKSNEFTGREGCSHEGFVVGAVLKHSFTNVCLYNRDCTMYSVP